MSMTTSKAVVPL